MTAHTRSFDDLTLSAPQASRAMRVAPAPRRRSRSLSPEYWLVFAVCLIVFVAALLVERLLPRHLRKISDSLGERSLFAEAMAAAHRYTAIAFQG